MTINTKSFTPSLLCKFHQGESWCASQKPDVWPRGKDP